MPHKDRLVLCGPFGSGKTEIAKVWAALTGGRILSFADPIRAQVAELLVPKHTYSNYESWTSDIDAIIRKMEDPETKDEFRGLLQELGKYRTRQDSEYWVRRFADRYTSVTTSNRPASCGDCRLDNQMELLKSWGFTFVLLDPTGSPHVRDQGDRQNDETEQYWPHWEYDHVLDYQEGVMVQARRLIHEFGINGSL